MNRIRDYYLSQGYEKPYAWSHYEEVPFVPLKKPLSECRVTLFSTSDVSIEADDGAGPCEAETTVGNVYSIPWDTPLDKVFTVEQPFLPADVHERWMKRKEAYREQKAEASA